VKPGYRYRVGGKPLLIEILTKNSGVSFGEEATGAVNVRGAGRLGEA
jgi:hypothetical protein